jgi:hypothetical protein
VSALNLNRQENEMKFRTIASAVVLMLVSTVAFAQSGSQNSNQTADKKGEQAAQPNPFSTFSKFAYGRVKTILVSSAEKMPEENYNFKPTDAVRSYGQIVGQIEQTKTTKADLVAALKDAVAYCDKAYDSMTDASGSQMVKLFDLDMPKLGVLNVNNMHDMEHYGNLVTYMRLKNIVPPTSEQPPAAPQKK